MIDLDIALASTAFFFAGKAGMEVSMLRIWVDRPEEVFAKVKSVHDPDGTAQLDFKNVNIVNIILNGGTYRTWINNVSGKQEKT